MGKVSSKYFIDKTGIKETFAKTGMGNQIFILNNNEKYKKFDIGYRNLSKQTNIEFAENLEEQTDYYGHDIVSFPRLVIKDKKSLYGIVGTFEEGEPILKINPDIEIDYLLYLIYLVEKGIDELSQEGWVFEDLHEENILVNPTSQTKPICIIDTDYYVRKNLMNKGQAMDLYKKNLKALSTAVMLSVLPSYQISNISDDLELKKLHILLNMGEIKVTDFLRMVLYKLKLLGKTPNNIDSLRKMI